MASELDLTMPSDFGQWVRGRREIIGLSQSELSQRTGIAQSHISAYETGRSIAGTATREKLVKALSTRPSVALQQKRNEILEVFYSNNMRNPMVFGSVARGSDTNDSDVDFLVQFPKGHNLLDTARVVCQLEKIITFPVEVYNPEYHKRWHTNWYSVIEKDMVSI